MGEKKRIGLYIMKARNAQEKEEPDGEERQVSVVCVVKVRHSPRGSHFLALFAE